MLLPILAGMNSSLRSFAVCLTLVMAGLGPADLRAQAGPSDDVLDEIRSLAVRVDVVGGGAAGLRGPLESLLTGELQRAGILRDLPTPREGDCCVLRLDLRVVEGSSRVPDWGGIAAYSGRLELGQPDRLGRLDTWVVLWTGRTLGDVVDPRDLQDQLRFATRELAIEFIDRYLQRFPIR